MHATISKLSKASFYEISISFLIKFLKVIRLQNENLRKLARKNVRENRRCSNLYLAYIKQIAISTKSISFTASVSWLPLEKDFRSIN